MTDPEVSLSAQINLLTTLAQAQIECLAVMHGAHAERWMNGFEGLMRERLSNPTGSADPERVRKALQVMQEEFAAMMAAVRNTVRQAQDPPAN